MKLAAPDIRDVPVKLIFVPENRRKTYDKDDLKTQQFMASVHHVGFLHPIGVRPTPDGKFELVFGRMRLWLAKQLERETIPAQVQDWADNVADFVRITENVHRSQLRPTEEVRQTQALMSAWELMGNKELGEHVAGGIARAKSATREGGRFSRGTKEAPKSDSPNSSSLSQPADAVTAGAGVHASEPESTSTSFVAHLATQTGKHPRKAAEDAKIARTLTQEDLTKLDKPHVTRQGLIKIAGIEDPAKRLNVISVVALGMDAVEAVAAVNECSDGTAQTEAAQIDNELSDEEWLEKHCGDFMQHLQDQSHYRRDALLYRHDRDAKRIYQRDGQAKAAAKAYRQSKKQPFARLMLKLLFVEHPNAWCLCFECDGRNVDKPECDKCRGTGYGLPSILELPQNFR